MHFQGQSNINYLSSQTFFIHCLCVH